MRFTYHNNIRRQTLRSLTVPSNHVDCRRSYGDILFWKKDRRPLEARVQKWVRHAHGSSLLLILDRGDVEIVSIVDGDKTITDSGVLSTFRSALARGVPVFINNETLGCDPKPGQYKTCMVDYRLENGGPLIRKTAEEYAPMYFRFHVSNLT